MKASKRDVLSIEQELAVVSAIRGAERGNRGEIRVHLEARCKDPLARAERLFRVLGLRETEQDTGVLLYVAVTSRRAAVYAGSGIHAAVEPDAWQRAVDAAVRGFERGQPAAGLVEALSAIGDMLREHAPGPDLAGDELPDRVSGPADDPDQPQFQEKVDPEDVHDLVSIATDLKEAEHDELTREDVRRIAAELGISDAYLEEARAELERRRAAERAAAEARARLRKRLLVGGAVGLACLILLVLLGQRGLRRDLAVVERHRAQVRNVLERQGQVRERYRDARGTKDPERQAELAGSENRVAVERKRHDEAATAYNARAGSFPGRTLAWLGGLPRQVPLSDELDDR